MNILSHARGTRPVRAILIVCLIACALVAFSTGKPASATISLATAADPAFTSVWNQSDLAVANGSARRSWMWGIKPFAAQTESYSQSPYNMRNVLYWDKARMEITNPNGNRNSQWFVTSGLLTVELVGGRMKVGDDDARQSIQYGAAQVGVAGDPDGGAPTYADFAARSTLNGSDNRAGNHTGQTIIETVAQGGRFGQDGRFAGYGVAYGNYDATLGHNVAAPIWSWMNGLPTSWLNVLGYAISEPYWTRVKVGGVQKDVLVQLFQRRAVTYTPANSPEWRVEYGNIGQHYYIWRYGNNSRNLQGVEDKLAQLIQNERAYSGSVLPLFRTLPNAAALSLPVDGGLTVIARIRSQAQAQIGRLDGHNPADGRTSNALLRTYRIANMGNGEILAMASNCASYRVNPDGTIGACISPRSDDQIAQTLFNAWMGSPPHSAIIHDRSYDQFSIGVAMGGNGQVFAAGIFIGH